MNNVARDTSLSLVGACCLSVEVYDGEHFVSEMDNLAYGTSLYCLRSFLCC